MGTIRLTLHSATEGLRFDVLTDSRLESVLDTGKERVAASPVETLLHSLAGCVAMDVISLLRKKRQPVTAYVVTISGERRTEHPRSFTSIDVLHRVTGHAVSQAAVEDSVRLSVEKYCSVSHSLDPGIKVTHRVEIAED